MNCHLNIKLNKSMDLNTSDISKIDVKAMCKLDDDSQIALDQFENRKRLVKEQAKAPRRF